MLGWMSSWLSGVLEYLVPFLFKKPGTVLFIGLDGAGKTTLLFKLKEGKMTQAPPTWMPTSEELEMGNTSFKAIDIGGHVQVRRLWRDYFPACNGIVFIVDGSDSKRFQESKNELHGVLNDEQIADLLIAVLLNKIDWPSCIGEASFIYKFDLYHTLTREGQANDTKGKRPVEVFPVSILQSQGYGQAFKWLAEHMK